MIPLIRAGSIMPILRWMLANGRQVEELLAEADLGYVLKANGDLPIPLRSAMALLCAASRAEGPAFACRVVTRASVEELGPIGTIALRSTSVRDALGRIAAFLPLHTTHEIIIVRQVQGSVLIREAWKMRLDDETRHVVHQYVIALIQSLCANSGAQLPMFGRVALMPHPVHGLAHLHDCVGVRIEPAENGALELVVPDAIANRPLAPAVRAGPEPDQETVPKPLRGDGTFGNSVKLVLAAMLLDGLPTIGRMAHAAGTSARTLQRRLGEEGRTFSDLLEEVRRDLALDGIAAGTDSARMIASALGYGQQSSLTRAVRRWTGASPRALARDKTR